MSTVPPKYQGTSKFFEVYKRLISACESKETVTYGEIAQIMELPLSGSYMAKETGRLLGEISEMEHQAGRPLLSALVVRKDTKKPGPGFFLFAQQLGKLSTDASNKEKATFWEN